MEKQISCLLKFVMTWQINTFASSSVFTDRTLVGKQTSSNAIKKRIFVMFTVPVAAIFTCKPHSSFQAPVLLCSLFPRAHCEPADAHQSIELAIHQSIDLLIHWSNTIDSSIQWSIDPSIHQSINLSIYWSNTSDNWSIDLSIHWSINPLIYRSIDPLIYRAIAPSIHQSINILIHGSINLPIHRSIDPSIRQSIDPTQSFHRSTTDVVIPSHWLADISYFTFIVMSVVRFLQQE